MWREGLGAYKIVIGEVDGGTYKKHPATQEFIGKPEQLWLRLHEVRQEMLNRGYHPKPLPVISTAILFGNDDDSGYSVVGLTNSHHDIKDWQTLEEQIEVIRLKKCKCDLESINKPIRYSPSQVKPGRFFVGL